MHLNSSALTSPLARAFEGRMDRQAEQAVVHWLLSPEMGALLEEMPTLPAPRQRQLGATLDAFNELFPEEPRSRVRDVVLLNARDLATSALAFHPEGKDLKERWHLSTLAIPPSRLKALVFEITRRG